MHYPNPIAARSRRGKSPGVTGAPRLRITGCIASLIMLAALAIRLASMMPGVAVLHWHGAIAVVHAGGGLAHAYGEGACGGDKESGEDEKGDPGETYYSPADIPAQPAADSVYLSCEKPPRGLPIIPYCAYCGTGAKSPAPSRGPPQP